jgi:diguanylate cyclase (GGDEF)-like protein
MLPLHPSTLLLSVIAIATTTGVLLMISSRQNRAETALVYWGAANLVGALSLVLLSLRGVAHDRVTIDIANAATYLGYMLNWAGMRHFCRQSASWKWILAPSLFWLVICQWPAFHQNVEWRVVVNSLIIGGCAFAGAATLWSLKGERLVSRLPAIIWLIIHGLIFFSRVPLALTNTLPESNAVIGSAWVTLILLEGLVHVTLMSFLQLSLTKDRAEERYRRAAETDVLTGLPNRRAFFDRAQALVAKAVRTGRTACVLVIDVDRFKTINDTLGHGGGDAVLVRVATAIQSHLRPEDTFGRLGGEEFGCLLPDTSLQAAAVIAEGLRLRIAGLDISTGGQTIKVSVSIGVSAIAGERADLGGLLDKADACLYEAKRSGRDRVVAMDEAARMAG